MARSFDIASFEPSDGVLNEQLRRKLNGNFRRVCELVGTESPVVVTDQASQTVMQRIPGVVSDLIDSYMKSHLGEILSAAQDASWPVGSVIVTSTSSDPRLSHGTWEQVGAGRYVLAAGEGYPVMSTGGEVTSQVDHSPEPEVVRVAVSEDGPYVDAFADPGFESTVDVEPEFVALLFYRRVA